MPVHLLLALFAVSSFVGDAKALRMESKVSQLELSFSIEVIMLCHYEILYFKLLVLVFGELCASSWDPLMTEVGHL